MDTVDPGDTPSALTCWRADLTAASGRGSCSPARALWLLASRPGVLAVGLLRLQQHLWSLGLPPLAMLVRAFAHAVTGADFVPGCRVGAGLRLEHPNGVVFGRHAVVGRAAFVCQRVTLGERLGVEREPAYPIVGDRVFLGAGATVLGDVRIGSDAVVGACAVVLRDVPAGATAVGNPARVVRGAPHVDSAVRQML